ncbi:hypothetical protein [Bradyrhizobium sp. 141]|uniref:hypothetical protein n=1 Tax=Bradyrhizobium sp. 141 TaxID=2782617 RepID=UPI001FF7892B|nr:hypothetical protein [Bradyrhizobium sp. 141]MCK1722304.1 hypothetical protein [Bradyrhizobium sp. 141]
MRWLNLSGANFRKVAHGGGRRRPPQQMATMFHLKNRWLWCTISRGSIWPIAH